MTPGLEISIVVPVRLAQHTIRSTLDDLLEKCRPLRAEVIAVVSAQDPTAKLLQGWSDPQLRVLVSRGPRSVPQLRRDGVFAAQAPLVAITEDHCLFPQDWVARQIELLRNPAIAVCGGPVDNARFSYAGWAQYFTRYCAFLPPGREGPARALPGNNACYRASVLNDHRELLKDGFWEAEFNRELLRRNCSFWSVPALMVQQRQQRGALEYIPLRYRHGRCYGASRFQHASSAGQAALLLRAPLIPVALFARAARAVFRARWKVGAFLLAAPLLAIYFLAWTAGEAMGYLAGAGRSCSDTD